MKVVDYHEIPFKKARVEGSHKAQVRWLISKEDKAENFSMRLYEIEPEGYIPYNSHDWEHEIFVLEGEGETKIDGKTYPMKKDTVIYIEPNQKHSFKNTGNVVLKFLLLY